MYTVVDCMTDNRIEDVSGLETALTLINNLFEEQYPEAKHYTMNQRLAYFCLTQHQNCICNDLRDYAKRRGIK